ncbi:MAG: hypothetical protein L0H73_17755 [Nitrococcus sp.]|nr:hypothetical protein [Nitrococcus sp.]
MLVVAGAWASKSWAEEPRAQADDASRQAPANFQAEALDDEILRGISGKGGVDILRQPLDLSIILWDEPGRGGTKRQALAENTPGDSIRGLRLEQQGGLSIGRK